MAKIRFIAPVDEARGTIGGVVFSANKSGTYAKARRQPSQPFSTVQNFGRAIVSQWPNEWRALDQSQRDDWDTWAADPAQEKTNILGQTYYLSGFQWFVALNTRLYWFLLPFQEDPPSSAAPSAPTVFTPTLYKTGSGDNSEIAFSDAEFADYNMKADFALLASGVQLTNSSQLRTAFLDVYPLTSTINIQSSLETVFGTIVQGFRWIGKLYRVDDNGQISAAKQAYGVVMP